MLQKSPPEAARLAKRNAPETAFGRKRYAGGAGGLAGLQTDAPAKPSLDRVP